MTTEKNTEKQKYACWLCSVPGVGDKTIDKLRKLCPDVEGIYRGGEKLWEKVLSERQMSSVREFASRTDPDAVFEALLRKNISFISVEEEGYPKRLKVIPDSPFGLFYRGRLPEEDILSVAVVGARECSAYGSYVAQAIGAALGEHQVQVISGMARGIDGISQEAALEAGGSSFGVLGCGVDICYPKSNQELYEKLAKQGGILSAYPPGTEPRPQNFPPRNRIVSGLADVLIVVEARNKSGTLITVDMALEQGREVFVVPGRVTDRLSDGCNRLLKQGAGVFLSPEDFLREFGVGEKAAQKAGNGNSGEKSIDPDDAENTDGMLAVPRKQVKLAPELTAVCQMLEPEPKNVIRLGEKRAETMGEKTDEKKLMVLLMRLCMEKLAVQVTPGSFALLQFGPNQV